MGARVGSAHLDTVPLGLAPGHWWARIVTTTNEVLAEHEVTSDSPPDEDLSVCLNWIRANPGGRVHVYLYDGDSGVCNSTILVDNRNRR